MQPAAASAGASGKETLSPTPPRGVLVHPGLLEARQVQDVTGGDHAPRPPLELAHLHSVEEDGGQEGRLLGLTDPAERDLLQEPVGVLLLEHAAVPLRTQELPGAERARRSSFTRSGEDLLEE